jgi:hypothetical protein
MAVWIDLTMDCANAGKLAEFWKFALGYEDEPPPAPFTTRLEWAASFGPLEDDDDGAWLRDPAGLGPRLCLLRVPEPKTAKNRLHIDIRVDGTGTPEQRWARITEKAATLTAAGAAVLWQFDGHHVVMVDPEGNEFCVAAGPADPT